MWVVLINKYFMYFCIIHYFLLYNAQKTDGRKFYCKKICFFLLLILCSFIWIKVQVVLLICWSPDTCWCLFKMHRILFMTRKNIFLCYSYTSREMFIVSDVHFSLRQETSSFSIVPLTKPSGPIFLDLWRRGKKVE